MHGKNAIWDDIKHQFAYGGTHIQLIIINVTIFIAANLLILFGDNLMGNGQTLGSNLLLKFEMQANFKLMLSKPWAYITYMFLHTDIMHLFFNMLVLFTFARVIREFAGDAKILPLYIFGGLSGAALMAVSYNIFPYFHKGLNDPMLGASAGIMAILLAAATLVPDYTFFMLFFGPVKIKWIALFYIVMDIVLLNSGKNAGGHIAHLGGAIFGIIYILQLRRGRDFGLPIYWLEDQWAKLRSPRPKLKVTYKKEEKVSAGTQSSGNRKTASYTNSNEVSLTKQELLDNILDKINRSGYDSLSKAEKDFLFKISQED